MAVPTVFTLRAFRGGGDTKFSPEIEGKIEALRNNDVNDTRYADIRAAEHHLLRCVLRLIDDAPMPEFSVARDMALKNEGASQAATSIAKALDESAESAREKARWNGARLAA